MMVCHVIWPLSKLAATAIAKGIKMPFVLVYDMTGKLIFQTKTTATEQPNPLFPKSFAVSAKCKGKMATFVLKIC